MGTRRASIPEHLLKEVWKDPAHFLHPNLTLADGSELRVLDPGIENEHRGGPDFLRATLALGNVSVTGDVELHVTPSHWTAHNHSTDARYAGVVLHVVLEEDDPIAPTQTHKEDLPPRLPTLILRDNLLFDRRELWEELFRRVYDRSPELPCFPHNLAVPMRFKRTVLERFGEARLDELIERIATRGEGGEGVLVKESDLLERVYQRTMDALGYSQNRTPFKELSSLLPRTRLQFVRSIAGPDSGRMFEALFFGVAGLLPQPSNDFDSEVNEYLVDLRAFWNVVQFSLNIPEVLAESDWAFFRIRPLNTPYRRLAVAAALADRYFSRTDFDFTNEFFESGPAIGIGDYPFWASRSSYRAPVGEPQLLLGTERRSAIWLNVILPARIACARLGLSRSRPETTEKVLRKQWAEASSEQSAKYLKVIEQELLESETVNSVRSEQGALTLLRNFCEKNRCCDCPVGHRLLEKGWDPKK
jgi:hypothetical protein